MRSLLVVLALATLSGCPKEPEVASRSTSARPCARDADCNGDGGTTCGLLRQCVDSMCSAEAVLSVPCR